MTALAKERMVRKKRFSGLDLPQKGSTTVYTGALVVIDAGYAKPGTAATGLVVCGLATETKTNSGADGANTVHVDFLKEKVLVPLVGLSGELVAADVGELVYVDDDQTISHTATGRSAAGILWKIETINGVQFGWVELA